MNHTDPDLPLDNKKPPMKTCRSLAVDAIVDAVTGKGNDHLVVVLYNTPFYLYFYPVKIKGL